MSKQPMKVPASALIFKDIRVRGFWMSAWNKAHRKQSSSSQASTSSSTSSSLSSSSADPSREMIDFLCSMIRDGKLSTPKLRQVPFTEFRDALKMSVTPMITEKQVLVFWGGGEVELGNWSGRGNLLPYLHGRQSLSLRMEIDSINLHRCFLYLFPGVKSRL